MSTPRLLDLFSGAGGAAMGYYRAGFEVVGVDIHPQPNYPFEFHQADALTYPLDGFDAYHASPPCQGYTQLGSRDGRHPLLIEPIRARLQATGVPYVIENVVGAPVENPLLLCGSMFQLGVRRHRLFESNVMMFAPAMCHHDGQDIRAYYGKKGWLVWSPKGAQVQKKGRKPLLRGSLEHAPADMGIDWMKTWDELRESIPPVYTLWIGAQLLSVLTDTVHP